MFEQTTVSLSSVKKVSIERLDRRDVSLFRYSDMPGNANRQLTSHKCLSAIRAECRSLGTLAKRCKNRARVPDLRHHFLFAVSSLADAARRLLTPVAALPIFKMMTSEIEMQVPEEEKTLVI